MKRSIANFLFALIAASFITFLSYHFETRFRMSDFRQPLCSAHALVEGRDPYAACSIIYRGKEAASYPLTTFISLTPFTFLKDRTLAGALFFGISVGLLTYGILRKAKFINLLLFISPTFLFAFVGTQFAPFLAAVMTLPFLLPFGLIKPQIGLPIIITNLNKRRAIACTLFILVSLVIYPGWPSRWLSQARNFDGLIPILIFPLGPLLLIGLVRWRDPDMRFLLLMACMPQRSIYDLVPLWLIHGSLRESLILTILSWFVIFGMLHYGPWLPEEEIKAALVFIYLPLFAFRMIPSIRTIFSNRRQKIKPGQWIEE